jgi:hypothetical protein
MSDPALAIVAGVIRPMLMAKQLLPWRIRCWAANYLHKFMRPLVPLLMIIAFLVTVAACIWHCAGIWMVVSCST